MAATQIFLFHSPVERWSGFVRLILEEKDADYEAQTVNSLIGEQYEPGYVEDLNEQGTLPTLVHKNKVVINWNYIARYIEKTFKEPPLIPADATEQREMDTWLEVCLQEGSWRFVVLLLHVVVTVDIVCGMVHPSPFSWAIVHTMQWRPN
jgi:glutathione S-transferase